MRDSEVFNEVRKVFIRVEINSSLGSDNLLLFETFSSMSHHLSWVSVSNSVKFLVLT